MYRMYGRLVQHLESNNQQCKAKVQPAVCLFFCVENLSYITFVSHGQRFRPVGLVSLVGLVSRVDHLSKIVLYNQLISRLILDFILSCVQRYILKKTATTLGQKVHFCIFFCSKTGESEAKCGKITAYTLGQQALSYCCLLFV